MMVEKIHSIAISDLNGASMVMERRERLQERKTKA